MTKLVGGIAFGFGLACSTFHGTRFEGRAEAPLVPANAVGEQYGDSSQVDRLGEVRAQCEPVEVDGGSLKSTRLFELDCSEPRLRRALRETAAARGGTTLIDVRCTRGGRLECRAGVGRLRDAAADARRPAPRPVAPGDVRGELGHEVEICFERTTSLAALEPRSEENVRELGSLPVSHVRLGNIEAQCANCDELASRDALRIAAGRLGASDLVAARCLPRGAGYRCVAELARPERAESPL